MRFLEFKDSDYEIHDRKHLDKYLVELASLVVENQQTDPAYYGMVAACVLVAFTSIHHLVKRKFLKLERASFQLLI